MIIVLVASAGTASAQGVRHVPPAETEANKDLSLVAEAAPTTPTLVAHIRQRGTQAFSAIELVRKDEGSWVAVVPATSVMPPGIDYYLTAGDAPVFATPEWPHTVEVLASANSERRGRDMLRTQGRRSRVATTGEWVEFGNHTGQTADHYYRFDADFSYRLWQYPLETIRVGYTRLLGTTPMDPNCSGSDCTTDAGFKVGGWFELGLAPVEGIQFDGRMSFMATQEGFGVGGRGEARLGDRNASHVALGVEYLAAVGTNGFFRLGWGTVPGVPMSATVEITNLPATHRDPGVRLYYDIARDVGGGVRVGLRVGYAARIQSVAGFTGGAGASVEF
ncbi:MAG TPA: hypothetical protein VL326_32350 [Kofleriaceae bacterium]|nr:hypothetical protein [Kofleriaceae bacterium]